MAWWDRLIGRMDSAPPARIPSGFPAPRLVERHDSVSNSMSGLGGIADKGTAGRPSPPMYLSDTELGYLYTGSGTVRRIVDIIPERGTRRGWSVPEMDGEDRRLMVWDRVASAWSQARLFGGALLLMVTDEGVTDDARWLAAPLSEARLRSVLALHVFAATEASPVSYVEDITSQHFGQPEFWRLSRRGFSAVVHHSRVLHFRGAARPESATGWGRGSNMPDDSVVQHVWHEVRNLTQTMQAGATVAQELRQAVIKISSLPERATGDQGDMLVARLKQIIGGKSAVNAIVMGDGEEYSNEGSVPAGFGELSESMVTMLCIVLGWPRTMLAGDAPGGLSTDDKSGSQRERQIVSSAQERLRYILERLYGVLYSAADGPTRGKVPPEWTLEFAPLDEPDEGGVAAVRKVVAETDAIYVGLGVYRPDEVTASRFGPGGWQADMEEVEVPDPADDVALTEAMARLAAAEAMVPAAQGVPPAQGAQEPDGSVAK